MGHLLSAWLAWQVGQPRLRDADQNLSDVLLLAD
jgi:hypothetical protein